MLTSHPSTLMETAGRLPQAFLIGPYRDIRAPFKGNPRHGVHQRAIIYELLAGRTYEHFGGERVLSPSAGGGARGHSVERGMGCCSRCRAGRNAKTGPPPFPGNTNPPDRSLSRCISRLHR